MHEKETLLILGRWYTMRREAFGIDEGRELASTAEKETLGRWLERYGLATVNAALWDVILKGKSVEGYHPRLRDVGKILKRDYRPLSEQTMADVAEEKRYIGSGNRDEVLEAQWKIGHDGSGWGKDSSASPRNDTRQDRGR